MRRIITTMIATAALFTSLFAAPANAATPAASQQANATAIADLVDRHNAIRQEHGLSTLKFAPKISEKVSQPWSMKMSSTKNLSHNPSYGWPGANRWAENVAYTSTNAATGNLMQMWMDSPGHRTNILNGDYDVISIGVVVSGGLTWATANFYAGPLRDVGALYSSGSSWLKAQNAGTGTGTVNVYTTPGTHHVNGRDWRTVCAPYSRTRRCTTQIRGTQVTYIKGRYVSTNGWVFNNMTYLPSARALWSRNNLGRTAEWTTDGRRWRTECDTAATGGNGCRTYIWSSIASATPTSGGYRYSMTKQWVFNNIVQFS